MPIISLTDFVDFVAGVGPTKLTKVRQIKSRQGQEYAYRFDYWRELREAIIVFHSEATGDKKYFDRFIDSLEQKKQESYGPLAASYKSFLGRKRITSTPTERTMWTHKDLQVRVNPELRLNINNKDYLLKLYFKATELTKTRVDVILLLMKHALPSTDPISYGLLDVQHNRLYDSPPQDRLLPLLYGEAESFVAMWNALP
jgi:hypothetical protein